MNMTIVLISKQSMELLVLLVMVMVVALTTTAIASSESSTTTTPTNDEALEGFRVVQEADGKLDDNQLSGIVKNFGEHLRDTMDEEMKKLIDELESNGEQPPPQPSGPGKQSRLRPRQRHAPDEDELNQLLESNEAAGQDIKARVELAGDNGGALPQAGLGVMASSFASRASKRLQAAGSYIGNKISSLGDKVKRKIPPKLRRFFKWPTFLSFKIKFHKVYKSLPEELYRQMVFLHEHVKTGIQHIRYKLGRDKHLNGQNQFSDMTNREYAEQLNNPLAGEDSSSLVGPDVASQVDELTTKKLEQLAREGKNVFGMQVPAGRPNRRQKRQTSRSNEESDAEQQQQQQQSKRQRRERRNVDHIDDDDDEDDEMSELNESESDMDFQYSWLGNDLAEPDMMDVDENDPDSFKTVEEYANGIDLSNLDEVDDALNDVLDDTREITPIDLRDTGCIIEPENQGVCGCCYSHAINTLASYYNCMDKGGRVENRERYHVRFVADCGGYLTPEDRPYKVINGCHGGVLSKAFEFVKKVGVIDYNQYGIAQVSASVTASGECAYPRPQSLADHQWKADIIQVPMFKKSRYTQLGDDQIELHLRTIGPVTINVRTWRDFKAYQAGILDHKFEDDRTILHSMVIVGIDREVLGKPYYIIRNSHGTSWGEGGYLKISRDMLEYFTANLGGIVPNFNSV